MAAMKHHFLALAGALVLAGLVSGCYTKATGGKRFGTPFAKDSVEGYYERSLDDVFNAARQVVIANGVLVSENTIHGETNIVRTLEGRVSQRRVYMRVQPADPKVTGVEVQARTSGGGRDLDLAHQLEKEIALKLVTMPAPAR